MTEIGPLPPPSSDQGGSQDLAADFLTCFGELDNVMRGQLTEELQDVEKSNTQVSHLNDALTAARDVSAGFADKDSSSKPIADIIKSEQKHNGGASRTKDAQAAMNAALTACNLPTNVANKGDVTVLVENLKSKVDTLGNSLQLNMTRVSSLSEKTNNNLDMMTNLDKSVADDNNTIAANLR